MTRSSGKCFAAGWLGAWAIALYLSAAVLAALDIAPAAHGCGAACTFAVVDEVSPAAKLVFGLMMGALMLLARRNRPEGTAMLLARDLGAALAAMLLTLAILPQEWSRGFGIGIFDGRFVALPTAIYCAAALVGAALGHWFERCCRRRLVDPSSRQAELPGL